MLDQSNDGLKSYLINIKGSNASMSDYISSLEGNFTNIKQISSAIEQYNNLSGLGAEEQSAFSSAVSASNSKLGSYLKGLKGSNASMRGYIMSLIGATARTVGLQVATTALNSVLTWGISVAISGVVTAITKLIHRTENIINASEDAKEKIRTLNEEFKQNQTTINNTAQRYAELAQGVDQLTGKNISLNEEDYKEFLNLSSQLSEIFPTLTQNYSQNGDVIVQLTGNVDNIVESLHSLIEAQRELANQEIADNLPTVFKGIVKQSTNYKRQIEDLKTASEMPTYFTFKIVDNNKDESKIFQDQIDYYKKIFEQANIDLFNDAISTDELESGTFSHTAKLGFMLDASDNLEKLKEIEDPIIQEYVKEYEKDLQNFKTRIENINEKNRKNWSSLNSSIFAWLNTDDSFKVMDDSSQSIIQNIINNLDWSSESLNFSNWGEAQKYIEDNILSLFDPTGENLTLPKIQVMLDIQSQFNNSDITIEEYQNKIQKFSEEIGDLPDETKKSILCLFGIQTDAYENTTSDIDVLINNVKSKLREDFHDNIDELTLEELQIATKIEVDYGTLLSWDELISKINEPKFVSDFEVDLSSSKENIDDFQNKLSSLSDIYSKLLNGNYTRSEFLNILQELSEAGADISGIESLEDVYDLINDLKTSNLDSLISQLNIDPESNLANYLSNIADEAINVKSALEGVTSSLTNIQNGYATVTNSLREYNKYGYLTIETLNDILTLEPEYLSCLMEEDGQLSINRTAYENLAKAQINKAKQAVIDEAMVKLNQIAYENLTVSTDKTTEAENTYIEKIKQSIPKLSNYLKNLWQIISAKFGISIASATENYTNTLTEPSENLSEDELKKKQSELSEAENLYNQALKINERKANEVWSDMNTKLAFIENSEKNIGKILEDSNSYESSDPASPTPSTQSFDWLQTKITRTEEALDHLSQKASDTYSSWTERNNALSHSIDRTKAAIELQRQAYSAYMKEADSLGLPEHYKTLVQSGAINANDIVDSNLADQINEYQELYEKALSCSDTVSELEQSLNELTFSTRWNNIKTELDAVVGVFDTDIELIQTKLDNLEIRGLFADSSYYSDMKDLTAKKLVTLNSEAGQLKSILGSMSKDNEGYNNLFSELMDINKEIAELENNCIEFNTKIRDLDWEIFDYLEKSVSRITDETEYLTELLEKEDLFDENGSFTKYGDAALGLHSAAYEAYKIQADDYYKEILKLQKQLADGAGQDVLEHYNELSDAHRDAVNAANSEKQSMLDLIEDGYNAQLDAIQELIDKKKEQLNSEKDLYDYQKSIAEKTAKVSSLEKQKLAYADDGSEEAMSRIQQLNVQLEEAKTDLAEAEYDKYLQDTEDMLDKLSEDYENWINKRLDDENALLSEIIGAVSDKGDRINGTLNEIAAKNGTFISDSIRGIFDADQPFAAVMNGVKDAVTGVGTAVAELKNAVLGISGAGNGANAVNTSTGSAGGIQSGKNAGSMSSAPSGGNSGRQGASSGGNSWGSWFVKKNDAYSKNKLNKDSSIVDRLKFFGIDSSFASRAAYYKAMGGDGSYISSASQNVWMLNQMKSHGYKSGTFRAVSGPHWTQENGSEFILRKSDGAMLVPLGQGDMVFSNESSKRLYEFAQNPEGFMKKYNLGSPLMTAMIPYPVLDYKLPNPAKAAQKNASASVSIGDINITCNEVQNARELMEDVTDHLIRNNRFEKAMSTMINNRMTGKNPLEHLKYVKH